MNRLSICVMLVVAPFTGLRTICVEAPPLQPPEASAAAPAGTTSVSDHHEKICPRVVAPASGSTCLFVPQSNSIVLLEVAPVVGPPVPATLQISFESVRFVPPSRAFYLGPALSPQTPPPKPEAGAIST
jgi:hypothetical protein